MGFGIYSDWYIRIHTHFLHGRYSATAHIATLLQNYVNHSYAGTQNSSGDEQLHLDIDCDNAVFRAIRDTGVFSVAASEETPVETDVRPSSSSSSTSTTNEDEGPWYSIGFDPLDGSSIIDANFSVGSIFGIWPGKGLLGRTGREQVASAVSLYGPRTTLVIALPSKSRGSLQGGDIAFEVTLVNEQSHWEVSRSQIVLKPTTKVFGKYVYESTETSTGGFYHGMILHYLLHGTYLHSSWQLKGDKRQS